VWNEGRKAKTKVNKPDSWAFLEMWDPGRCEARVNIIESALEFAKRVPEGWKEEEVEGTEVEAMGLSSLSP